MPEVKPKKCTICNATVNTLASFAQVSLGKLAHLTCVKDQEYNRGYLQGKADLEAAQREEAERNEIARRNREAQQRAEEESRKAEEDRERREGEKQRLANLRYRVDQLPRCAGCGKRVNVTKPHRTPLTIEEVREVEPDAMEPPAGYAAGGRCRACAEVERAARNAVTAKKEPEKPKDDGPKQDRFELIETE